MTHSAIHLWYECIGKLLSDAEPDLSTNPANPTRLKKGIGSNRLGAGIDAFFIANPGDSYLISKIECEDLPGLTFLPAEQYSGPRYVARWIIDESPIDKHWMVGVIGKARINAYLMVSQPPLLCYFCEANKVIHFNLQALRDARELMGDMPWKGVVGPAINLYSQYKRATSDIQRKENGEKLQKLFEKNQLLRAFLAKTTIQPSSGEYDILSWYYREDRA